MPVSAATVIGVSCEAPALDSFERRCACFAYACLKAPTPTPTAGWWTAILTPFVTSFERPLVTRFTPPFVRWRRAWRTFGAAAAAIRNTTAPITMSAIARRPHANTTASTTPAMSARKLDCENEKSRPTQTSAIPAAAPSSARSERLRNATTSVARIATTRKRP